MFLRCDQTNFFIYRSSMFTAWFRHDARKSAIEYFSFIFIHHSIVWMPHHSSSNVFGKIIEKLSKIQSEIDILKLIILMNFFFMIRTAFQRLNNSPKKSLFICPLHTPPIMFSFSIISSRKKWKVIWNLFFFSLSHL